MNATNNLTAAALLAATLYLLAQPAFGVSILDSESDDEELSAEAEGVYAIAGTTANIELEGEQEEDEVEGEFRHTLVFQGLLIDFVGEVTCLAFDISKGRAWIGGIVTENNSDHSAFTGERNEPGRDIWFRVLDDPDGGDRTTFVGFEGDGGIITSAEYCDKRIWPGPPDDEPNARTNPMIEGEVDVEADD